MGYIGDDSNIRLNNFGYHFGTMKPDFLLNGVGKIDSKGQLNIVFLQQSCYLGNHKSPNTVVKGTADEFVVDTINGSIVTFVDITKRLTTIRELEKINADHQVLMFALSHDMKQPISTIKLLSSGLIDTYKRQDQENFHLMIKRLQSTSNALTRLVDEFTANGEANLQQKEKENLQDLKSICEDVLDALREEIQGKNIKVLRNYKATAVLFPKNSLRSVIYNLLHNAIKYKDNNRATVIQITSSEIKGFVIFSVEDNGLGIAEEHQEKVFRKSSRLNKEIEGTGMGLYIIKNLMETHGGRIELTSTLGEGSKFEVFFKSATA